MVKMDDNSLMPFGAFKGQKLANVPAWYLLKLYDNNKLHENLKQYIEDHKLALEQEKKRADRDKRR